MSLSLFEKDEIVKSLTRKEHQGNTVNALWRSKLHKCSLRWSDKCAHCDEDFDSLFQKISATTNPSNETLDELKMKIKEAFIKLKELEDNLKIKLRNCSRFVQEDVDIRFESLKEDLELLKDGYVENIDKIVNDTIRQMSTEFSEFMSENRVDLNQIDINKLKELVETNMMNLQDNFNSLFQMSYETQKQLSKNNFDLGELKLHSNRKPMRFRSKAFYLDRFNVVEIKEYREKLIEDVVYLSNGYTAVYFEDNSTFIDIYDENWNIFKEAQELKHIQSLGKMIVTIDHDWKLTIMDANFQTLSEFEIGEPADLLQSLEDNRIAVVIDYVKILILKVNEGNVTRETEISYMHSDDIYHIIGLSDGKFATTSENEIIIWSSSGIVLNKIQRLFGMIQLYQKDYFVIKNRNGNVEILNYTTGESVKEINIDGASFIGIMPFGFITKKKKDYHTYDYDGNYTGEVVGYNFKLLYHIKHLKGNLYASWDNDCFMIFEYTSDFFEPQNESTDHFCAKLTEKTIECPYCKFNYRGEHHESYNLYENYNYDDYEAYLNDCIYEHPPFKVKSKRCAFCELGYNKKDNDIETLKSIYLKSLSLFEDAKRYCIELLQEEASRFKDELSSKIDERINSLDKIRTSNANKLCTYVKEVEKHYEIPMEIFDNAKYPVSIQRFDDILHQIQKYREVDFYIKFNFESFEINQKISHLEYTLQQTTWDLPKIYFDHSSNRLLQTISIENNYMVMSLNFTENYLAFVKKDFVKKKDKIDDCVEELEIYNWKDGRILFSKKFCINNLDILSLNDKFLIAEGNKKSEKEQILLIIRLDNFNYYELTTADQIFDAKFLDNGDLLLGGHELQIWNASVWPFVQILKKPVRSFMIVPLPSSNFVTYASHQGCLKIWNSKINLLNEIAVEEESDIFRGKVEYFKDDLIMIYTNHLETSHELKIMNYKNSEIKLKLMLSERMNWSMRTPDECFLVIRTKTKLIFYNLIANYYYSTYDLDEYPIELSKFHKRLTDNYISAMWREDGVMDIYDLKIV